MNPIGTIKLTWINPDDLSILESAMFDKKNLQGALEMGKTKPDFMVFQLIENKDAYYKWQLLPYGEANRFLFNMKMSKNILVPYAVITLLGFAAFGIYKAFNK